MVGYLYEYQTISRFYGGRVAERSGVPLMNHIEEGLDMLSTWERSDLERAAFCLHPIVQNDEDVDVTWSSAYPLACEYRDRANNYLCRPETDHIVCIEDVMMQVGGMSEECAYLLLADKVQNQKDFLIYHSLTHPRRVQLRNYFNLWIEYLLWDISHYDGGNPIHYDSISRRQLLSYGD